MTNVEMLPEGTPLTWPKYGEHDCHAVAPPPLPFLCLGPDGHDGPHVAEGFSRSIAQWEA